MKFVVDKDLTTVVNIINNTTSNTNFNLVGSKMVVLETNKEGSWRRIYRVVKMPYPMHVRDFLSTRS